MSLAGLPDFQRPIQGERFQIFYPYQETGNPLLTPAGLEVAVSDGRPQFLLELVRGANPALPPAPYGVLDLKVQPHYPMANGLTLLRAAHPAAMLDPVLFAGGFLRLIPEGDDGGVPAELRSPTAVTWNGLATGRSVMRLSQDTVALLKGALQGGVLALYARAEMEIRGIAPRLSVRVRFDPQALLTGLRSFADGKEAIPREKIVQFFARDRSAMPVQVVGDNDDPDGFAQAMTDWVRARFASFVPAPEDEMSPCFALKQAADVGSGSFEWDLGQAMVTFRPLSMTLHPLEAARRLVAKEGITSVLRETVVPPIATGLYPVAVSANLPPVRPGILAAGVNLKAAPRLPFRPQAVTESGELTPPDDRITLHLRLAPGESPSFTYSTYLIRKDSSGVSELTGPETPATGGSLYLSPADFPLQFVSLHASSSLLELATLDGSCRWRQAQHEITQPFQMDDGRQTVALGLPPEASDATLEVRAHSRAGGAVVTLGPLPARSLELGLHSFREYGPHAVSIECTFQGDARLLAVDLVAEDRSETSGTVSVVALTPSEPHKVWTYFAPSPFTPGYRFRLHAGADETPQAWSEARSPFESLELTAGGAP